MSIKNIDLICININKCINIRKRIDFNNEKVNKINTINRKFIILVVLVI